jgi:hypothetical protein
MQAALSGLAKPISQLAGRPKNAWSLSLLRSLSDALLACMDSRSQSPGVEERWLNLTGFCLRPGLGHGFDPDRIKALWKIYKKGPVFANATQVSQEWWILWRRVAAGLSAGQQRQFFQDQVQILDPKNPKTAPRMSPQEKLELWMAMANMERLPVNDKIRLGRKLLDELNPKKALPQQLWSLSRFGLRAPLYGSVERVVPPAEVAVWIRRLIDAPFQDPAPVWTAMIRMARKTGDRMRDVDDATLSDILAYMTRHQAPADAAAPLTEVITRSAVDDSAVFGESLPAGIVLQG